jgi:hypothetical protein
VEREHFFPGTGGDEILSWTEEIPLLSWTDVERMAIGSDGLILKKEILNTLHYN